MYPNRLRNLLHTIQELQTALHAVRSFSGEVVFAHFNLKLVCTRETCPLLQVGLDCPHNSWNSSGADIIHSCLFRLFQWKQIFEVFHSVPHILEAIDFIVG